jgi:hypothetical protein
MNLHQQGLQYSLALFVALSRCAVQQPQVVPHQS